MSKLVMSKHVIAGITALSLLPVAQAHAQEDAAPSILSGFFGPYVGVQAGWGHRSLDRTINGIPFDENRDNLDYGAFAGFDTSFGTLGTALLVGVEAEVGGSAGKRNMSATDAAGIRTRVRHKINYAASARLGVAFMDMFLLYARGGYGAESVDVAQFDPANNLLFTNSKDRDGWFVGGGAEYLWTPNIGIRGEYRYKHYSGGWRPQQVLVGVTFRY